MKKSFKRILATVLTVVMVMTAIPLSGIAMLDWASVFATISSALSKSEEPVNASSDMACDFIQHVDLENKDTELKHSKLNVASSKPRRMLAANKNSDNPNTYTVLLLDKEASHNLTSGGTYICTLGSPVENVKAAALKLIDQIRLTRGTTHVAIVTFDSSVQVVQNFTTDYTTMRNSIDKISSGSTWANVNGAYQKADELLSAVTDNSADKNIVLFSQGLAYAGDHTTNGIYSEEDCNWYRTDTNIHAYEYSNSAYATAQSLMSKYNIYSIGLYQSFDTVPEAGQSLLSFALSFAEDVQNSGFYSINDINDLEFNMAEDVFNLAVAIDPDKIIIPVRAIDSSGQYVNAVGAAVSVYSDEKEIITKPVENDGNAVFSKSELYSKGINENTINSCTVSAHFSAGEIELCSERVSDKGSWYGENLLTCSELICDEPRKYYSLDVRYSKACDITTIKNNLNQFANDFAECTNGHCLISTFFLTEYANDHMLVEDFLSSYYTGKEDIIYIFENGDDAFKNCSDTRFNQQKVDTAFTLMKRNNPCNIIVVSYKNGYMQNHRGLIHEAGHLLFDFLDEYISENGLGANGGPKWKNKPKSNYGVMDHQWTSHEMSTESTYAGTIIPGDQSTRTQQYAIKGCSCESDLAEQLKSMAGNYKVTYTFGDGQTDEYFYDDYYDIVEEKPVTYVSDYFQSDSINDSYPFITTDSVNSNLSYDNVNQAKRMKIPFDSIGEFSLHDNIINMIWDNRIFHDDILVCDNKNRYCYSESVSIDNTWNTFLTKNSSISLYRFNAEKDAYVNYCLSRFDDENGTNALIQYESDDVLNNKKVLSPIFEIVSDKNSNGIMPLVYGVKTFDSINFDNLSWYKYQNDEWIKIDSGFSYGEYDSIFITAESNGQGKYVLLAETANTRIGATLTDFLATLDEQDKYVRLSFNDTDTSIVQYDIYVSNKPISEINDEQLLCCIDPEEKNNIRIELPTEGINYFTIVGRYSDGAQFIYKNIGNINNVLQDTDKDGIPNSWFVIHPQLLELEDIPRSDPDDDGLDNLTEYQYGTNPLCPDTDGDNVYDKIELLKKLDPLNPKTDGETDDYIVAYGTPELKITNLHFDERYVYFSVENDTDSKAMRTVVDVRSRDSTIALWTVNIDGRSVIDFAVERGMLAGLDEFTISVDEGMITRDSDYSNNTFNYSASASITLNDIDIVKNTAENLVSVISPETANEIYRYTLIDGSCITLDEINGSIFADKIGQAHIQVESLSGNADTCLVSVISFEGAEYSEFECLKINETEVAITGYYGESTSVEIPESIGEFTVTAINSRAFNNIDVESISIPDSVSEISETAFYVNNTINSFIVGENNPAYCSDGGVIYNKDKTTLVAYPPAKAAETFDIPDTVTCIGSYAFNYNTFLTSISIDNGITEIGSYAFYQCSSLNAINIDSSVTNIGTYAFYGCTNLSEAAYSGDINDWCKITFSSMYSNPSYYTNGIKINGQPVSGEIEISSNVGAYSLYNFTDITKVTVSDGVETIGKYAFRNCSNLKDVIISNSVSSIQNGAFRDCNKIENMSIPFVGESRTAIKMNSVFGYIFDYVPLGSGTVRQYYSSSSSYGYYIPSSIKTVTITDATKISYGAFYNCSSITDIIINDSVTNMGEKCFANCNGLVNLTIPFVGESRTATGINGVFGYFFNSSDTSDDNTVTQYYESSGSKYYYIPTSIESITITDAEQLPYGAFYNCSMLKNISLNQKITDVGTSAFSGCSALENTYYTGSIESWCNTAFANNTAHPNYYAKHFYLNGELIDGEFIVPDSITNIPAYSFYNFTDVESIKLSNTVESVGTSAFYGCSELNRVEYDGTIDDWYGISFDNYASNPNYYAENLYVDGSLVSGSIIIPDYLDEIPIAVFAGCKDITEVNIGNNITSIGKSAFDKCAGLTALIIPESVILIDGNAFCDCTSLKELTVPCSVEYKSNCFKNSTNIEKIIITKGSGIMPDLKTSILTTSYSYKYTPWYFSDAITDIIIEDGVEYIGDYEFRSTYASNIVIPDSVTSIGKYAFYGCSKLNKLTVPTPVVSIGSSAISSNTVVYCFSNSAAHIYAKDNSLNFVLLDFVFAAEGSTLIVDNDSKLISGFVNGIEDLDNGLVLPEDATVSFDRSIEKVYTGMPIKVLDKNGKVLSEYSAVIIGDVDGDGWYDGMDAVIISSIAKGKLIKEQTGDAVWKAADCNFDGIITEADTEIIEKAGIMKCEVFQTKGSYNSSVPDLITFYVPETIYLNPGDFKTFQYYVDRENSKNSELRTGENTTGNVYVNVPGATNISVSCSSGASVTIGATTGTDTISTTITAGSFSSAIAENTTSTIEWTAKYVLNGVTYSTKAYSTVYAPYRGTVACEVARKRCGLFISSSDRAMANGTIWVTGIHSMATNGGDVGNYQGAFNHTPLLENCAKGSASGITGVASTTSCGNNNSDPTKSDFKYTAGGLGWIGYWQKSSDTGISTYTSNHNAEITVDSSRYSNLNSIPNLTVGLDIQEQWEANEAKGGTLYIKAGSTSLFSKTSDTSPNAKQNWQGYRFSFPINSDIGNVLLEGEITTRVATVHPQVQLNCKDVNKAGLRNILNAEIATGKQQANYTSELWTNYQNAIKTAYLVLGNPLATQTEVDNAKADINRTADALVKITGVAYTEHITISSSGTTILETERKSYNYGDKVSIAPNEYEGYTFVGGFAPEDLINNVKSNGDSTKKLIWDNSTNTITFTDTSGGSDNYNAYPGPGTSIDEYYYIPVVPGSTMTFMYTATGPTTQIYAFFAGADKKTLPSSDTWFSCNETGNVINSEQTWSFTVPSNVYYLTFRIGNRTPGVTSTFQNLRYISTSAEPYGYNSINQNSTNWILYYEPNR